MVTRISPQEFREADGLEDWQVEDDAASIVLKTPDFGAGAAFVGDIAEIANGMNHHPDVDLRYSTVTVRTSTHSEGGLTDLDVALAQRVTEAARARGFRPA